MEKMKIKMPYFDHILTALDEGNEHVRMTFGKHVHWGYFEDLTNEYGLDDMPAATEKMTQIVLDHGGLQNGHAVLDSGCGFGGTVSSINERLSDSQVTGLNIDERQLVRARKLVSEKNRNKISFVCGDACQMPFKNETFDRVFAVECIFHYPSRLKFFEHARRVLKIDGMLVVSDFVPLAITVPILKLSSLKKNSTFDQTFGDSNNSCTMSAYKKLAHSTGFKLVQHTDITRHTLPSYSMIHELARDLQDYKVQYESVAKSMDFMSRMGLLRYKILVFKVIT